MAPPLPQNSRSEIGPPVVSNLGHHAPRIVRRCSSSKVLRKMLRKVLLKVVLHHSGPPVKMLQDAPRHLFTPSGLRRQGEAFSPREMVPHQNQRCPMMFRYSSLLIRIFWWAPPPAGHFCFINLALLLLDDFPSDLVEGQGRLSSPTRRSRA